MRLWAVLLSLITAGLAAAELKEVRKTVPLAAGGRLSIDTHCGSIRVDGWDSQQAEIYARVEDADWELLRRPDKVKDTEIQIDALSENSVRIRTDYHKVNTWLFGDLPQVHYTVRMPRTARLVIKDHRSEIEIRGLQSDIEVDTYRGALRVRDLDGSIQYHSHRGEADIRFANLARNSRIDTYRAEVEVWIPRGRGFQIDSDLGRRASLKSDFPVPVKIRDRHGKDYYGPVNGGGPSLRFKSYRGSLRLRQL